MVFCNLCRVNTVSQSFATSARTKGSFNGGFSNTKTGPLANQDVRTAGLLLAAERYRFRSALVSMQRR